MAKTAFDKGYVTRERAAAALHQLADDIGNKKDSQVVKLNIGVYAMPDDGSCDDGEAETEQTVSIQT